MQEQITTLKLWIIILIGILIPIIVISLTETDYFIDVISYTDEKNKIQYYMWIKFALQNISFFIAGLIGISLVWEVFLKRTFTNEILEKVNLSTNINESGIIKIYSSFQDIERNDWDDLLRPNVKFLKLFFSSSTLWTRSYLELIKKINEKKRPIEIYMPNFTNSELIKSLSIKDNQTESKIKDKIEETYKKFQEIKKTNSKLQVILVNEIPIMTFYMNENKIIIATYSLISKDENVPTFIAKKDGNIYQFAEKEIQYLNEKYNNEK